MVIKSTKGRGGDEINGKGEKRRRRDWMKKRSKKKKQKKGRKNRVRAAALLTDRRKEPMEAHLHLPLAATP